MVKATVKNATTTTTAQEATATATAETTVSAVATAPAVEAVTADLTAPVDPVTVVTADLTVTGNAPDAEGDAGSPKADELVAYRAVFGGPMVDIDSGVVYTSEPAVGPMTGWLESQIEAGKIEAAE